MSIINKIRVYMLKRLLKREDYLKLIKKLSKNKIMSKMPNKYIWYCPRRCNAIIIKTKEPVLRTGTYRCNACGVIFTSEDIIIRNKKNIKKFLDSVDKK